jgi:hypothetical protein
MGRLCKCASAPDTWRCLCPLGQGSGPSNCAGTVSKARPLGRCVGFFDVPFKVGAAPDVVGAPCFVAPCFVQHGDVGIDFSLNQPSKHWPRSIPSEEDQCLRPTRHFRHIWTEHAGTLHNSLGGHAAGLNAVNSIFYYKINNLKIHIGGGKGAGRKPSLAFNPSIFTVLPPECVYARSRQRTSGRTCSAKNSGSHDKYRCQLVQKVLDFSQREQGAKVHHDRHEPCHDAVGNLRLIKESRFLVWLPKAGNSNNGNFGFKSCMPANRASRHSTAIVLRGNRFVGKY